MSVADILLSIVDWLIQKIILPVFPENLPFFSISDLENLLQGSLKHNLIWAFAGIGDLINLKLLFTFIGVVIFCEVAFWVVRAGIFLIKIIRG